MTRWVQINLILFLTIIALALFTRLFSTSPPAVPTTTATPLATSMPVGSPAAIPSQTPATTSAISDPAVLGSSIVTDDQRNLAELTRYESNKLSFMTMLPTNYVISNDVLSYKPAKDEEVSQHTKSGSAANGTTAIPATARCNFTKVLAANIQQPGPSLEGLDLPLVSLVNTTDQIEKIYLVRTEENTPKLEVHCTADWPATEAFYTILRSIRFL